MSLKALYTSLEADLLTVTGVQHVALWNNQLENEKEENPFLYPAIFIEFVPSNFIDKGNSSMRQDYELTVRLHICFEAYNDNQIEIYDLKDLVWLKMHKKQYDSFTKLSRKNEVQDFNHGNVQDYIQEYTTKGVDEETNILTRTTLTTLDLDVEIVQPDEL